MSTLKLAELRRIAFKCGISTSGTKPLLLRRIENEVNHSASLATGAPASTRTVGERRILSVDMGIRNLAYCIIRADPPPPSSLKGEVPAGRVPSLIAWKRMAVSSAPIMEADEKPEKAVLKEMEKESFEPPVLAALAYSVMRNTLLVHNPTHVLIERQRFRSMGSSHILEWTIRVNMLEAMFYAILHTLKMEGHWNGQVVPVAPGKVGPFWLDSEGIDVDKLAETAASSDPSLNTERKRKTRTAKLAKALNKGAKIDLVQNWLIEANRFHIDDPDVKELAVAYRKKWEAKPGTVKGSKRSSKIDASPVDTAEKMGKLDDLADSLLQGMAFIEWEKNKQQARVKGLDSLL